MTKVNIKHPHEYGIADDCWDYYPISDICFFQEGPGLRNWQWTEEGMKVINITNIIGDGSVNTHNTDKYISFDEFDRRYKHFEVEDGDIVIASSGWSYGKTGRIKAHNLPLMMNTSVIRFRSKNDSILDNEYLYAFLRSAFMKTQIDILITGVDKPNFGPSHIKRMSIPLPDIVTQQKIASILSAYDDLIENNLKRIKLLEEAAQNIYKEWFVNFRFPGHESAKFGDDGMPEGWEKVNLYDFCEVQMGFPFKAKDFNEDGIGNAAIRIRDIPKQNTKTYTTETVSENYIVKRGDILIGMDGFFYIDIWGGQLGYLVQRVCRIRAKEGSLQGYLLEALRNPISYFEKTISGATVAHLGAKHLKEIFIYYPTSDIVSKLDSFNKISKQKINLLSQNQILKEARNILLPRLMDRRIEV